MNNFAFIFAINNAMKQKDYMERSPFCFSVYLYKTPSCHFRPVMSNAAKQKDVPTLHGTVRPPPFSAAAAFYSQAVIRLWTATAATRKSLQKSYQHISK